MKMEPVRKKRTSVLAVMFFLFILGAAFVFGVATLISPTSTEELFEEAVSGSGDKVAIVRVENVIMDAKKPVKQLKKWAADKSVSAIVLRVVSPGGVVTPSQEIYNAVKRAMKKKPVVASLGSVAASGGYYIAAPCDSIVASPGTITGSIGVIMMFPSAYDLMGKLGLGANVVKSGRFKDSGSPYRVFTEEDRAVMDPVVMDTYDQFITAVAEGRELDKEEVMKVADGRIFTGRQALEMDLVDELGDLDDAVKVAGKLTGIKGTPKVVEQKSAESLIKILLGDDTEYRIPFHLTMPPGAYFIWPVG